MINEIKQIKIDATQEISAVKNLLVLENIDKKYLGRNGKLRELLQQMDNLPKEEKPKIGQLINQIRKEIENLIQDKKLKIENWKLKINEEVDITLPGERFSYGHLHPSTQLKYEVADIFSSMGFEILEGPEVENEWYNFDALNIPSEHPARDMWDTFYLKSQTNAEGLRSSASSSRESALLLRPHTSNMQVRMMEKRKPPLKVCAIGKCFRHEATNATHEHTLYQIEGFVVDEKISMGNLIYTLKNFLNALYKKEVKIRIRPAYFPFVEPGLEIDIACVNCESAIHIHHSFPARRSFNEGGSEGGCPVCHGSGWIELLGAGMIHPKVFEAAGYPKDKYTGFAFGVGLDRLVMMHRKIDDIRWLHSGDLRFIRQW